MSLDRLETEDPTGRTNQVLRVLAVLSPDGVPRDLLHPLTGILGVDTDELDELLQRCAAASVITWSVTGQAVLMHRLLGRVLRERDHLDNTLIQTTGLAVNLTGQQLIPAEMAWQQRAVAADLIDQVEAVWTALSTGSPTAEDDVTAMLLDQRSWAVRQLTTAADLTRAIDLGHTVLTDSERVLGADHPNTLTSRNNLAYAYRSAGRLTDAIPLYEQTAADRQRVLGADHPNTLTSRNNLAYAYESAGRLTDAIPLYEQTAADRQRVLGVDHPHTVIFRSNLAAARGEASDA